MIGVGFWRSRNADNPRWSRLRLPQIRSSLRSKHTRRRGNLAREASDDGIDALMAAEANRLAELLKMMPTTIAGCAAMMRWIETYSRDEANQSHLFHDWDDPWSEPGSNLLTRLAMVIAKKGG
jgi:hypothetical protein